MSLPITIEVKVVKVGNSLRIVIPAPVKKKMGIEEGDTVELALEGETMIVKKVKEEK